jgi:membrane-associated phospholipid phosphatase
MSTALIQDSTTRRANVVSLTALMIFIALLVTVLFERGPVLFDTLVLQIFEAWRTPDRTAFVRGLTGLGGHLFMIPASAVVILLVFWRQRRSGVFLFLSIVGSAGLNECMKMAIDRPRPTIVLMVYQPRGLSFPSGHSQSTMAFALALMLVFWSLRGAWTHRALAILMLPLVVGWTRTYLGVHYPTDVLAGWALATVWVMLCYTWYRHAHLRPFAERPEEPTEVRPPGEVPPEVAVAKSEIIESVRSSESEPDDSAGDAPAPPPR